MKSLLALTLFIALATSSQAEEIGLGTVMMHLHPGGDWVVSDRKDGSGSQIVRWNDQTLGARPTAAQIAEAKTTITASRQLRASLLAEFATLSPGEQALYKPALEGIRAMLDGGNLAEARKIIFLSPVPTEALAAARLRMLALFPSE